MNAFQPKPTANFSRIVKGIGEGVVLKPLLHSYLFDADFPEDFSVDFHQHKMKRDPDGWFHPSTHPLWPARKLWLYANHPDACIVLPKEYMGALSVTIGTAVHSFIQMCLDAMGVLVMSERIVDGLPEPSPEHYVEDIALRSRGSMDGVLKLTIPGRAETRQLFEFKTSNLMKLSKLKDLDLDAFRNTWPDYYVQVQEYMRMSGLRLAVVLFMAMGYPWELREFHVPFDESIARDISAKYRLAVQPDMPQPCCGPGSKTAKACEMRLACPVGQMS